MLNFYNQHFGLRERPFALQPDARFFHASKAHSSALTMLQYGIVSQSPITVLTGEIGLGKSTLLRHLFGEIRNDMRVILLSDIAEGDNLLHWVMHAIGQPARPGETDIALHDRFQSFLIAEYSQRRKVLLVIDEAQHLSTKMLEMLRMMTNINFGEHDLLQLILVGQSELRNRIMRPDMTQFAHRIGAGSHLGPMDLTDTGGYLDHRLMVAGATWTIFEDPAVERVHALTGGVPRLINQLADMALLYAAGEGSQTVGAQLIDMIVREGACPFLSWRRQPGTPPHKPTLVAVS